MVSRKAGYNNSWLLSIATYEFISRTHIEIHLLLILSLVYQSLD